MTDNPVPPNLGLLAELAGTWRGGGLNLAARPDFRQNRDAVLAVSRTADTISFTEMPAVVHNRGFTQADLDLYGLTYLQRTDDADDGAALHIETGMWINQPPTTRPPADPPSGGQLVARMWNIPHGASFVAQGFALPFTGPPVLGPDENPTGGTHPAFAGFPSFNGTPVLPGFPDPAAAICAAGTTAGTVRADGAFTDYTIGNRASTPPGITQELIDDPVVLLQRHVAEQVAQGYRFEGVALNISTAPSISFRPAAAVFYESEPSAVTVVAPQFGGEIANLAFLRGVSEDLPNMRTTLVYATFWLQRLTHPDGRPPLLQLQYAQSALVNFPDRTIAGRPNVSWPHVTVATLHRD